MMRLKAGVVSDCGHVRSANEDSFLLRPGLYAVCDGMGGARAGEVASQMACLGLLGVDPVSAGSEELRRAVVNANRAIIQRSASESELLGMGTTLTAAMIKDDNLLVAHVGDSRAYLFRDGSLTQLTADHSWVGEMVRRGEITPSQAARHPHRSVITRALGTDQELDPDVVESTVQDGDRVLLCSDGLTGMVDDETIAEILSLGGDAQTAAQSLVDAALANGGEDNVTVVLVDIGGSLVEGDKAETASWSDSRIMVGPSSREASVPASSHGAERLSMAARERLRRRGAAIARPGSRSSVGKGLASSTRDGAEKSSRATEPKAGQADAGAVKEDKAVKGHGSDTAPGTVPPPTGGGRKKKRGDGGTGRRSRRRRGLVAAVIVLLVLVLAVGGFAWYNSTVYYLGDHDGQVALYRGLPWEFLGIEFSSAYRVEQVDQMLLSPYERARVESHELVGKEAGERFLDGLSTEP